MNQTSETLAPRKPKDSKTAGGAGAHFVRIVTVVVLLLPGVLGYFFLSRKSAPPPPDYPKSRATETRVLELHRKDYQIIIQSQGPIRAHSQVSLTAQVSGRVSKIHVEFEEGAFFKVGQVLVELDPVDFELAVIAAEAQLAQAQLSIAEEQTRGTQARRNWEDLGYTEEASDLVLRKPQLKQAEAQLNLAEAQLKSAGRDLERSKVRAPFTGRVLTSDIGIGLTIGAATPLGVIFATDYSEVRLPVSNRALAHLSLPEDITDAPLEVVLRDGLDEESGIQWPAKILRTEGALDESTLELFAIARVQDPFGSASGKIPLRVGQPVIADIPGEMLEHVLVIPREAVTGLNRIRLVDPGTLTLTSAIVAPLWADEEHVIIRDPNIEDGTLLAMTPLVGAPDGGTVEILDDTIPVIPVTAGTTSGGSQAAKGTPAK